MLMSRYFQTVVTRRPQVLLLRGVDGILVFFCGDFDHPVSSSGDRLLSGLYMDYVHILYHRNVPRLVEAESTRLAGSVFPGAPFVSTPPEIPSMFGLVTGGPLMPCIRCDPSQRRRFNPGPNSRCDLGRTIRCDSWP